MRYTPKRHRKTPGRDRQQYPPCAYCSECGGEVYGEETVYLIDGRIVCRECLGDFAERYFASDAVKGERLKRGGNTYETY